MSKRLINSAKEVLPGLGCCVFVAVTVGGIAITVVHFIMKAW